jgi:hypothetical protein
MSDRWTSPTIEQGRSAVEVKTGDEVALAPPAAEGVDPVLGVSETDLELLDALNHQLALEASTDPRPNTPEEDADVEWLMNRARQRMSMSPSEVRAQRERDRR